MKNSKTIKNIRNTIKIFAKLNLMKKRNSVFKNTFLNELFDNLYFSFLIKDKIYSTAFFTEFPENGKNENMGDSVFNNAKTVINKIPIIIKKNRQHAE
ncbi:MAG: hypothetical protein Q4D53_08670 [Leptotrichiaceae bacterium]|nr:hypothetical protein [Leptotrichiaceae bacterium]